jgi:hypothetical protein
MMSEVHLSEVESNSSRLRGTNQYENSVDLVALALRLAMAKF